MTLKEAQQEVTRLAKEKGFPLGKGNSKFLTNRILKEILELYDTEPNSSEYAEELTDVLIQTIQAITASGYDLEEQFKKKMAVNFKREWKK